MPLLTALQALTIAIAGIPLCLRDPLGPGAGLGILIERVHRP